jgi:hypothetical protein
MKGLLFLSPNRIERGMTPDKASAYLESELAPA